MYVRYSRSNKRVCDLDELEVHARVDNKTERVRNQCLLVIQVQACVCNKIDKTVRPDAL